LPEVSIVYLVDSLALFNNFRSVGSVISTGKKSIDGERSSVLALWTINRLDKVVE
jgi:hypothetical protein